MVAVAYEESWPRVQENLRVKVGTEAYESWLKGAQFVSLSSGLERTLTISVALQFLKVWIAKHYLETIKIAATEVYGNIAQVSITVRVVGQIAKQPPQPIPPANEPKPVTLVRVTPRPKQHTSVPRRFKPSIFSTFGTEERRGETIPEQKVRKDRGILLEDIRTRVCNHYGFDEETTPIVDENTPKAYLVKAVGMYLALELTNKPLALIATLYGYTSYRDVSDAHANISKKMKADEGLRNSIKYLTSELQNTK